VVFGGITATWELRTENCELVSQSPTPSLEHDFSTAAGFAFMTASRLGRPMKRNRNEKLSGAPFLLASQRSGRASLVKEYRDVRFQWLLPSPFRFSPF
jgi:hypothetical protein